MLSLFEWVRGRSGNGTKISLIWDQTFLDIYSISVPRHSTFGKTNPRYVINTRCAFFLELANPADDSGRACLLAAALLLFLRKRQALLTERAHGPMTKARAYFSISR